MNFDFTLEKYAILCKSIQDLNCPVMPIQDFLKAGKPQKKIVILRHDVDRNIGAALRMAKLESDFGLRSTYYVRKQPSVFKPEALRTINRIGHEVGYHYEVLSKAKGDIQKAIQIFESEINSFREYVPVKTISMHGSPLNPWNNMDIWKSYKYEEYKIQGDAVMSLSGKILYYFTDTGRSWGTDRFNMRDYVDSILPAQLILSTDNLIDFLKSETTHPICISAHPNRWADNVVSLGVGILLDWTINRVKWGMSMLYGSNK
jgi:hypothetical protein